MITVDLIMKQGPCSAYDRKYVKGLIGKGKTAMEILDLPTPAADRVWVLTRPGVLSDAVSYDFVEMCVKQFPRLYEFFLSYQDGLAGKLRPVWDHGPTTVWWWSVAAAKRVCDNRIAWNQQEKQVCLDKKRKQREKQIEFLRELLKNEK